MRLVNTYTLKLHEFYDNKIPWCEYAILSHTWGEEEVSFHDLQNKKPEQLNESKGYMKLKECCALAASEGYEYVWIDTCCIDKTSSAELSEAINSMYRWYRKAGICYAYLVDVWIGKKDKDSRRVVRNLEDYISFVVWNPKEYSPGVVTESWKRFRESRWFTRGWTLQELLAPRSMCFFDKDWRRLGDKVSLKNELSSITGIQQDHMFEHTSASAAQKMSWASGRETTRLEDMAYSLMGIFDVNMPLLYGEGKNAFTRLQHEIVKMSEDESIFAWEDELLEESGMFARSPKAFAKSGDIVQIDDCNPLYVRRAPYEVTNRGFAIENFAPEKSEPARVSDLNISLLPLNCGRHVNPGTKQVEESVMAKLRNTSRDGFVRWSPWQLKPSRCFFNLTCPRLVYIQPIYTLCDLALGPPPLYVNAESLVKRRFLLAETFNCWSEREDLQWSTRQDEQSWMITVRSSAKHPAIAFKSSKFGCPALFVVILHAKDKTIDGIDLIVPPTDQTINEEMDKYSQRRQPPGRIVTRASETLQDGSQVSVILKWIRVDTESSKYLKTNKSWIYALEIA